MLALMHRLGWHALDTLSKRAASDGDDSEAPKAGEKEVFTSWSLFILIMLLIIALFVSYILQSRKIQAIHETVISIFSGMFIGLILRLTAAESVLGIVTFSYEFFFNLLLPPIILASGYELHQGNFFHNIGTILTFAFAGTFISAIALGIILYLWALIPIESMALSWVDALSVGATLSATDPVTILAIFNTYKVDPKLYTVIFGESILNDAIAIVLFQTAQKYKPSDSGEDEEVVRGSLNIVTLIESFGQFLLVFFTSLVIGLAVGIVTSLLLKLTYIRRFPKLESCIILLIAFATYFFATAVEMSGIVALLFCGICLKHYAYHNMSRRTQLTTKFIFQVLAQLSENFIFIYLGLSLFTAPELEFRPLFILVTVLGICVARYLAVFPLSSLINSVIRYRANRKGREAEEMPFSHQMMLFWAGLRGAVGVALAAGLTGQANSAALRATVLVVVVLTVIIFGGTTARMLEILNIRTGVVEEIDSDDEFDIEPIHMSGYAKRNGTGFGHSVKSSNDTIRLSGPRRGHSLSKTYSSGNIHSDSSNESSGKGLTRKGSRPNGQKDGDDGSGQGLLEPPDSDFDDTDLDLPPSAPRFAAGGPAQTGSSTDEGAGGQGEASNAATAAPGLRSFLQRPVEDPAAWFRNLDEGFIKPHLLLDPGDGGDRHPPGPGNV